MPGPMEGISVVEVGHVGRRARGRGGARRLGRRRRRRSSRPTATRSAACCRRSEATASSPPFELDNRNKRSVGLNLSQPEGRRIAAELVDRADVFVTNARPAALDTRRARLRDRVGAQPAARLRPRHRLRPRGRRRATGPPTTSARSGRVPAWPPSLTPDGADLPYQRGGMGDHMAGHGRGRRGGGRAVRPRAHRRGPARVDVAAAHRHVHARAGTSAWRCASASRPMPMTVDGAAQPAHQRLRGRRRPAVLDARPPGDRHWPDVLRAVGPPRLGRRPAVRSTDGARSPALGRAGRASSTTSSPPRPLAEWARGLRPRGRVVGAGAARPRDCRRPAGRAPRAASSTSRVDGGDPVRDGRHRRSTSRAPRGAPRSMPPEFAQHTEEVLLELGYDWDRIIELKDAGAIP